MQAQSSNRAPEWGPNLSRVERAAAHPSLQRRTTEELRGRLQKLRVKLATAEREFVDHPEPDQVEELLASYRMSIAAVELALEWRS